MSASRREFPPPPPCAPSRPAAAPTVELLSAGTPVPLDAMVGQRLVRVAVVRQGLCGSVLDGPAQERFQLDLWLELSGSGWVRINSRTLPGRLELTAQPLWPDTTRPTGRGRRLPLRPDEISVSYDTFRFLSTCAGREITDAGILGRPSSGEPVGLLLVFGATPVGIVPPDLPADGWPGLLRDGPAPESASLPGDLRDATDSGD